MKTQFCFVQLISTTGLNWPRTGKDDMTKMMVVVGVGDGYDDVIQT
jgi:hypothetical protein